MRRVVATHPHDAVMVLIVVDSRCPDAREECAIVWVAPLRRLHGSRGFRVQEG